MARCLCAFAICPEMPDQSRSFVVLVRNGQGWCLYDYGYGQVVTDALEPGWTGCADQSAREGEGAALIRSLEWVARESLDVPHTFCFDAQTVGFGVAGICGFDSSDAFMIVARSLAKAAEALSGRQFDWKYVKAHAGHVENEIADVLAERAALRPHDELGFPEYMPFIGGERFPIEQLWLVFQTNDPDAVLPLMQDNQIVLEPLQQATGVTGRIMPSLICDLDLQPPAYETFKQKWNFVTYNVSSLQPRRSAFYATYLREQMVKAGYDVSFLQETRCRESQLVTSQSH